MKKLLTVLLALSLCAALAACDAAKTEGESQPAEAQVEAPEATEAVTEAPEETGTDAPAASNPAESCDKPALYLADGTMIYIGQPYREVIELIGEPTEDRAEDGSVPCWKIGSDVFDLILRDATVKGIVVVEGESMTLCGLRIGSYEEDVLQIISQYAYYSEGDGETNYTVYYNQSDEPVDPESSENVKTLGINVNDNTGRVTGFIIFDNALSSQD